jgi:hypothetical protein
MIEQILSTKIATISAATAVTGGYSIITQATLIPLSAFGMVSVVLVVSIWKAAARWESIIQQLEKLHSLEVLVKQQAALIERIDRRIERFEDHCPVCPVKES